MIPSHLLRSRLSSISVAACHAGILLVVRTLIVDWTRPALLALIHLLAISAACRFSACNRSSPPQNRADRQQVWLLAGALALALVFTYWALALASLGSLQLLLACIGAPVADALSTLVAARPNRALPHALTSLDGLLSLALMWPSVLLFTFRDVVAFDGTLPVVCAAVIASAAVRVLTARVSGAWDSQPEYCHGTMLNLLHHVAPRSALLTLPLVVFVEVPLLWSRTVQTLAESSSAHAFPPLWVWLLLSTALVGLSVFTPIINHPTSTLVFPIHPDPTSMLAIGTTLAIVHMDLIATNIKIAQVDFRIMFVTFPIIVLGMSMYDKHVAQDERASQATLLPLEKEGSGEVLPMSATRDSAAFSQIDMAVRQVYKQSDTNVLLPPVPDQFALHSETDDDDDHPDARAVLRPQQSNPSPHSTMGQEPDVLYTTAYHAPQQSIPKTFVVLAFLTAIIALLVLPGTLFKTLMPPTPTCPATYTPTTARRPQQPTIPRLRPLSIPTSWPGQNEPVAHMLFKMFNAQPSQYAWDYRTTQPNVHGHRVLVLHADDRPLQSLQDVGRNAWALPHSTMGPLYGAWWALRHGYDFRRVQLKQPHMPQGAWGKVKVAYDALFRGYDVVVLFDSDSYPSMPEVGVEEMMVRWGMVTPQRNASLLLALDPPGQARANENATNTGFWIVRNTPVARRVIKELAACPESIECRKWWTTWAAEQAAFTKFVRTKMKEGDELIVAPCDEANGWWEFGTCPGKIVTHAWGGKHVAPANMIELMVEWLVDTLDKLVRGNHYHFQDSCVPWKSGSEEGERCRFLEDEPKR